MARRAAQTQFDAEAIPRLPPEDRARIIRSLVLKAVKERPGGVSPRDLEQILGIGEKTLRKHLNHLAATRELYRVDFGLRTSVFFPNGKLAHPMKDMRISLGDRLYVFNMIRNPLGEFYLIQERSRDAFNVETVAGGIVVPGSDIHKFMDALRTFAMGGR